MLTERRKKDREQMAATLAADVRSFPGFTADIQHFTPREIWVHIKTPQGVALTVTLDGDSVQPDTHVLSWHSVLGATFKYAPTFAPSVNNYHWHKATDICEGFESLRSTIAKRLKSVTDGSAFQ